MDDQIGSSSVVGGVPSRLQMADMRGRSLNQTHTLTRKWHNFNGLVGFAVNLLFLGF